jgi:hypothetical protein
MSPPPPPADLGHLRRLPPPPSGAKWPSQWPLPPPPDGFGGRHTSEEISGQSWLRLRRLPTPPTLMLRQIFSRYLQCAMRWLWWLNGIGGSILGGCSLCCDATADEDFPRPRLVGRASTATHAGQVCTWAIGECLVFLSDPLFSCRGHWPSMP